MTTTEDNNKNLRLLAQISDSSEPPQELIPAYNFKYETWYFFSKGVPLMISAVLEWGVPPWAGMAFAGHTPHSRDLQAALGYARVFYNITTLMTLFSMTNYFCTVLPGAIGAGRYDRVRRYFQRSVCLISMFWIPIAILQFFAGNIMMAVGVPSGIADLVGIYSRYMIPVGWMLMFEVHLEQIFINMGFERCAAFNSLVTGLGVDVTCTFLFVYKWQWGIKGVALAQCTVKAARISVWIILSCYFNLGKYFYQTNKEKRKEKQQRQRDIENRNNFQNQNLNDRIQPLLSINNDADGDEDGNDNDNEQDIDPFFSWIELKLFWDTFAPTLATYFTGWLIFELQIICLGHIAGITSSAVAAGAIWVQSESTLAAIQRGWLQVTRMRTLKLMGTKDYQGAKKAYTIMCVLSFVLVAITNIPLYVWQDDIGALVSNDVLVQGWLNKIIWVLILHAQTRICSINGGAIYVAVERGTIKVVQNIVGFYIIASPLAGVVALTNLITDDIATKMMCCVGATAVAQGIIGIWAFLDMAYKQDWEEGSRIITERANNDRILAQSSCGGSVIEGQRSPMMVASSPKMNMILTTSSLQQHQRISGSPLRSVSSSR